jgi:hypothetical protein
LPLNKLARAVSSSGAQSDVGAAILDLWSSGSNCESVRALLNSSTGAVGALHGQLPSQRLLSIRQATFCSK